MKTFPSLGTLMCAFLFASTISIFAQGALTPLGSPAPTMKTLDQIDTHIDTTAGAKRTPISSSPFTINAQGSYYLTGNLTGVASQYGILVTVDNVTIDLNGFALIGVSNAYTGIAFFGSKNLCVRNGTIRGWPQGGIQASPSTNCRFENLLVSDTSSSSGPGIGADQNALIIHCEVSSGGISVGNGSTVRDCNVTGNSGIFGGNSCAIVNCTATTCSSLGISVGNGCTITGCTANGNSATGIKAGDGATVMACSSNSNLSGANGISVGNGGTITGCTANGNGGIGIKAGEVAVVTACSSNSNLSGDGHGDGFYLGNGSTISNCSAERNVGDGIVAPDTGIFPFSGCMINHCNANKNSRHGIEAGSVTNVIENHCVNNSGAGISASGFQNRIESNEVSNNSADGINVSGAPNLIIRNSADQNSPNNYNIIDHNKVGVIVAAPDSLAINGSAGGAGVGTTDPWANLSY